MAIAGVLAGTFTIRLTHAEGAAREEPLFYELRRTRKRTVNTICEPEAATSLLTLASCVAFYAVAALLPLTVCTRNPQIRVRSFSLVLVSQSRACERTKITK